MTDAVRPGQVWRHYKGHSYFVVTLGKHSETLEDVVVYRRTDAKEVWVRPLAMWTESVEYEGRVQKRFARVR